MNEESRSGENVQSSLKASKNVSTQSVDKSARDRTLAMLRELVQTLSVAVDLLSTQERPSLSEAIDFYDEVRRFEISLIRRALRATGGNQAQAARLLGLNQPTLHGKIKQYQIYPDTLLFREPDKGES